MEEKPNKTGAIIGTVAASLLCGCPGLLMCLGGAVMATGQIPYETTSYSTRYIPSWVGLASLCLSIFFIAIPVVVGVLTLRPKKPKAGDVAPVEPLPPTS